MPSVLEKISAEAGLVSLPDVYLRLKSVLDDPDFDFKDVASVIEQDPGMTARLLKLVNSAYFGLGTDIDTVGRAIRLLGAQEVHDLVLAASVASGFQGLSNSVMDMERFWRHSVDCAIAARELASLCNILDSQRLFVNGLLHDLGHLFIYQAVPAQAQQAIELARAKRVALHKAERAVMGTDYAEVGAEMMRRWRLPRSLWEPTECQLDPRRCVEFTLPTHLLRIAVTLSRQLESGLPFDAALGAVSSSDWQATGLHPDQCAQLSQKIEAEYVSVLQLLRPSR